MSTSKDTANKPGGEKEGHGKAGIAIFVILCLVALPLVPILLVGFIVAVVFMGGSDSGFGCGSISELGLDGVQATSAQIIVQVGQELEVGRDGMVVAITTALAESGLKNYANDGSFTHPGPSYVGMSHEAWQKAAEIVKTSLNYPHDAVGRDWDSVNAFQQRPSMGWGSVEELMDPHYAAAAFYGGPNGPNAGSWPRGLLDIPGWELLTPGQAAQKVQVSAFPEAYNRHVERAGKIVDAIVGGACGEGTMLEIPNADGWVHPAPGYTRITGTFGDYRGSYHHAGDDFAAPAGTPILAAADGQVTHVSCNSYKGRSPCNIIIDHGGGIQTWYVHMYPHGVHVHQGQGVRAGQHIGDVGSHGNSTGPHLHFEVHIAGAPVDTLAFLTQVGITP